MSIITTSLTILIFVISLVSAIPPACLLQAVNTQDEPANLKAICSGSEAQAVQAAIASLCTGDNIQIAQSAFIATCSSAGDIVSPYTTTATATVTSTSQISTTDPKPTTNSKTSSPTSSAGATSTAGSPQNIPVVNHGAAVIALIGAIIAL